MNQLGTIFYNEIKDFKQAAEWFSKAADRGCIKALNNLGLCYELGHGVDVNMDKAYQLYLESSNKGYTPATFNLGYLFYQKAKLT